MGGGKFVTPIQNYLVALDGKPAGRLFNFAGGGVQSEVVSRQSGDKVVKHIVGTKYSDMVLNFGTGMSRSFYDWVHDSISLGNHAQNGSVYALDQKQKAAFQIDFFQAFVKSVAFPKLDAVGKSDAYMTMTVSPERTKMSAAGSQVDQGVYVTSVPRPWGIGSFKLNISGIDCSGVTSIEPLRIGNKLVEEMDGNSNFYQIHQAGTEYSDIVLKISMEKAGDFIKWADNMIEKGNTSDEKSGSLEFYSPDGKKQYFQVGFVNLGVMEVSIGMLSGEASGKPVTVKLYCEQMKFNAGSDAVI